MSKSSSSPQVIPLGFEPKTHSLEGCCSNPTELRNHKSFAKVVIWNETEGEVKDGFRFGYNFLTNLELKCNFSK